VTHREPAAPPRPASMAISRSGVSQAVAEHVDVRQGGIGRVEAGGDVRVQMGGIGYARAGSVSVQMGGMGAAVGERVEVTRSGVRAVFGRDARIGQSLVQTIVANEVVVERPSAVLFLVARRVSGDVRVLLDWRGALAFGAAFGVLVGLLRRRS
jgi:hypothetical protein